jgi:mannose-6-phosphate isomerase-like protein (cupin superfamily)
MGKRRAIIIKPKDLEPMHYSGRDNYKIVDPTTVESENLTFGLCVMKPFGEGKPMQVHDDQEEVMFVLSGNGTVVLNDEKEELEINPMDAIYVPKGAYHMLKNSSDVPLQVLWILSPPGWIFDRHPDWAEKARKGEDL